MCTEVFITKSLEICIEVFIATSLEISTEVFITKSLEICIEGFITTSLEISTEVFITNWSVHYQVSGKFRTTVSEFKQMGVVQVEAELLGDDTLEGQAEREADS